MTEVTEKPDSHWLDPPLWWRRARPLRWILLLGGLTWLFVALDLMRLVTGPGGLLPDFLQPGPHPETALYTRVAVGVPMAERFKSYQDVDSVLAALERAGFTSTRTHRRAEESTEYPPYAFDTLAVAEYLHLGVKGSLSMEFFNNRLFQVEFIPSDLDAYARKLRAFGLRRDKNARLERIEGDLRIASTVELARSTVGRQLQTAPYVLWQDRRLIAERDQWDTKFGAIAKTMIQD